MTIENNTFCWTGITTDIDSAKAFYASVLGWNAAESPDGTVCIAPGGAVAHLQPPSEGPNNWCTFLAVDDLDGRTAQAGERGAILVPPTALTAGRFSVVATPSGAVFALYECAESDEMAKPGPGSVHWVELQSTNPEGDLAWLSEVFGFTHRTQQMAMGPYHVLEVDGASRGGVMQAQSPQSVMMTWVEVADLDETVASVGANAGQVVVGPMADPQVGRMAVVTDPSGAHFGLVQPAARA